MAIEGQAIMAPDIGPEPEKDETAERSLDSNYSAQELEKQAYKQMVDKELSRIARANVDSATGKVSEEYLDKWLAYAELATLSDADDQKIREALKPFYEREVGEDAEFSDIFVASDEGKILPNEYDSWIKTKQAEFHALEAHGWRQEDFDLVAEELQKPAEDWEVDRPDEVKINQIISRGENYLTVSTPEDFDVIDKVKSFRAAGNYAAADDWIQDAIAVQKEIRGKEGFQNFKKWEDLSKDRTSLRRAYPGWESDDAMLVYLKLKEKAISEGLDFAQVA